MLLLYFSTLLAKTAQKPRQRERSAPLTAKAGVLVVDSETLRRLRVATTSPSGPGGCGCEFAATDGQQWCGKHRVMQHALQAPVQRALATHAAAPG